MLSLGAQAGMLMLGAELSAALAAASAATGMPWKQSSFLCLSVCLCVCVFSQCAPALDLVTTRSPRPFDPGFNRPTDTAASLFSSRLGSRTLPKEEVQSSLGLQISQLDWIRYAMPEGVK